MVPVTWLALIGSIYSRIAPFFALNRIFFPAKEEATLKTKQPTRFQGLYKVTNQITGRGKTKSIMWQILPHGGENLANSPPPQKKKKNEFNFKPDQYYIDKISELTKSCIWVILKMDVIKW